MRSRPSARKSRKNPRCRPRSSRPTTIATGTAGSATAPARICSRSTSPAAQRRTCSPASSGRSASAIRPAEYAISPDGKEIVWSQPDDPTRLISRNTLIHLSLKSRKEQGDRSRRHVARRARLLHDGTRVAVLATPTSAPSQHTRLMLVDLKSGKAERLAAKWPRSVGTYGSANPAWRADDQAILFCAEDAGVQHFGLCR